MQSSDTATNLGSNPSACSTWVPCRSSMVYWILCLLGVATLLPWNVFITESEFFDIRVHVSPTYDRIADSCETAIVLVFQFVYVLSLQSS